MSFLRTVSLLAVAAFLIVAAAILADTTLNEGRGVSSVLGRDRLLAACTPALIRELVQQGFSPQEVEIEGPPLRLSWAQGRSMDAGFTFQDGGAATRVDGTMTCTLVPPDVRVVFRTLARPIRVG